MEQAKRHVTRGYMPFIFIIQSKVELERKGRIAILRGHCEVIAFPNSRPQAKINLSKTVKKNKLYS